MKHHTFWFTGRERKLAQKVAEAIDEKCKVLQELSEAQKEVLPHTTQPVSTQAIVYTHTQCAISKWEKKIDGVHCSLCFLLAYVLK